MRRLLLMVGAAACSAAVTFVGSLLIAGVALAHEPLQPVLGMQELAVMLPEDIRPGGVTIVGRVSDATERGFTLAVASSWADLEWKVSRRGSYPQVVAATTPAAAPPVLARQAYAALGEAGDKPITLQGELDLVADDGRVLEGVFPFRGQQVRLRFELAEEPEPKVGPLPTLRHIRYGPHWRQAIDFYEAESDQPTPLFVYIHGGGWVGGDKSSVFQYGIEQYLGAGISVAAVNYRRVPDAVAMAVKPPVQYPLYDAARAIQFLRHNAAELNIAPDRIGAAGGSAGACTSLWLSFHDDLARPRSDDPIARESTRLTCAAVIGAQVALDPVQLREWMPNMSYGAHAFGYWPRNDAKTTFQEFYERREQLLPQIRRFSPYEHVSADDPPVLLIYTEQETPAEVGTEQRDPTHSGVMGIMLEKHCQEVGAPCELKMLPKAQPNHPAAAEFIIRHLKS